MVVRLALVVLAFALAGGLAARRAWLLYRLVRLGRPVARTEDLPVRLAREALLAHEDVQASKSAAG